MTVSAEDRARTASDMPVEPKRAVVLLSGGLDSATVLAIARSEGYELYALSFSYGQRHIWELEAAARVAASIGVVKHRTANIDLRIFGGSALTDDIDVPKGRSADDMSHGIPITYVPARNTIFMSFALAWAEVLGSSDIFIGVNALDYSGYPDCRPEFIEAFEKMANLATKAGVEGRQALKIHTPLIAFSKAQIISKGIELGVDYSLTSSCYDPSPSGEPCGQCDSCLLRQKGFRENGIDDPLRYRPVEDEAQARAMPSKKSFTRCREKVRKRGALRSSAGLRDAIYGRGARRIEPRRSANSAIRISWVWMATAAGNLKPQRLWLRLLNTSGQEARRKVKGSWSARAASPCCNWTQH